MSKILWFLTFIWNKRARQETWKKVRHTAELASLKLIFFDLAIFELNHIYTVVFGMKNVRKIQAFSLFQRLCDFDVRLTTSTMSKRKVVESIRKACFLSPSLRHFINFLSASFVKRYQPIYHSVIQKLTNTFRSNVNQRIQVPARSV